MKNLFFTLKAKVLIWAVLTFIICVLALVFSQNALSSMPKAEFTIVIDAGHGGVDVKLGQYEIF